MNRRRVLILYGALVLISFALNFMWESSHLHLYTDYGTLGAPVPLQLWATLGDVFYITGIILVGALAKRKLDWFAQASGMEYAFLALVGLSVAVYIEEKALLLHTWAYTSAMPLIPGLGIGLSPLLQMAVLLPLSVYLAAFVHRRVPREYH